jgi:ABC-2 type transport system ATP-binding protein
MTDAAVRVEALAFGYGARPVLDRLSMQVQPGEIFGVVGADGAGKSTLLQLLIGQLEPSSGTLQVLGMPARDPRLRERIAYMPQGFGQYLDLSVLENLRFFAQLHGVAKARAQALIDDLLARTGLRGFEDRRAGQLSGGMMQKLALACALVTHPQAMFLDEPTTGVDPVSRRAFWQLLDGVRAEGVAIVYTTANMEEAERCDRVGMLEGGHLAREGRPLDLVSAVDAHLVSISGPQVRLQRKALASRPGVEFVFPVGRQLKVWLAPGVSPASVSAWLAQLDADLRLDLIDPTLHDVTLRELALAARAGHDA